MRQKKGARSTGKTAALRRLSSKVDSRTLGSFTRRRLRLGSVYQESSRRHVKELGYMWGIPAVKPLLNQGQHQRHLIWAKEKKTWTVAQWSTGFFSNESSISKKPKIKACRKSGQTQNPSCLMSSVKFPQLVMIWSPVTSVGVDMFLSMFYLNW